MWVARRCSHAIRMSAMVEIRRDGGRLRLPSGVLETIEAELDLRRARTETFQSIDEDPRHDHPPIASGLGHCAARGRQLLACPAAVKAYVGFHSPLPI